MNTSMGKKSTLSLVLALCAVAGCSQLPHSSSVDCSLSETSNVDKLFAEAADKLEVRSCQYAYPRYQERLIAVAKGAPGPDNEARFAGFLRQAIELGVISRRQAQETFSRYFDPEFYAVKSEARSSCSSLRQKDKLRASMRSELAYKKEGMLEILDDAERFRKAQHYYNDLNLVFDAVNAACTQEL